VSNLERTTVASLRSRVCRRHLTRWPSKAPRTIRTQPSPAPSTAPAADPIGPARPRRCSPTFSSCTTTVPDRAHQRRLHHVKTRRLLGHRDNILSNFDQPLLMGAATVDGSSLTEEFIGGDSVDQPDVTAWSSLSTLFPVAVSTSVITLNSGSGAPSPRWSRSRTRVSIWTSPPTSRRPVQSGHSVPTTVICNPATPVP